MYQPDSSGRDPFVVEVLDQIFNTAQIDSQCVSPDYRLGQDLGLNPMQIQVILFESAKSLGLPIQFENCRVGDLSSRELVQKLRNWSLTLRQRAG